MVRIAAIQHMYAADDDEDIPITPDEQEVLDIILQSPSTASA